LENLIIMDKKKKRIIDSGIEFIINHKEIIQREKAVTEQFMRMAPEDAKSYYLEKNNLYSGLLFGIKKLEEERQSLSDLELSNQ